MARHHNDESFESSCQGKQPFDSREEAARGLARKRAELGGKWKAYKCVWCSSWHQGHASRAREHGHTVKRRRRDHAYA